MSSHQRRILKRAVQRHSFVAWIMWVRRNALRILRRALHKAAVALVEQSKVLRLPAPKSIAQQLAVAVDKLPAITSGPAKSWACFNPSYMRRNAEMIVRLRKELRGES